MPTLSSRLHAAIQPLTRGNRFDRMEWAGAFGDLGTLIPFVVAYLSMLNLDPFGVLFTFGLAMVVAGLVYRTPFPVQPMKAAGAVATTLAAQTLTVTAGAVYAASLVTGVVWLLLGLTGTAQKVTIWNVGIAFVVGSAVYLLARRGWLKL